MPANTISLKTVLHEINEPGRIFRLKFRKLDGAISEKQQVKKNPSKAVDPTADPDGGTKKDLKTIRRNITNSGALILYDCLKRHPFEVKIELLVEFDGLKIFHSY